MEKEKVSHSSQVWRVQTWNSGSSPHCCKCWSRS